MAFSQAKEFAFPTMMINELHTYLTLAYQDHSIMTTSSKLYYGVHLPLLVLHCFGSLFLYVSQL
jgi:hypothetical protein